MITIGSALAQKPASFKQMAHRRAKARPDVARPGYRLAGEGDHALG
jgi:hypothetical protein